MRWIDAIYTRLSAGPWGKRTIEMVVCGGVMIAVVNLLPADFLGSEQGKLVVGAIAGYLAHLFVPRDPEDTP